MFGDVLLLEQPGGSPRRARRLELGETGGRSEAWLRDTLFAHPEILPLGDIAPSFGPLIPLCTELRTEAGPVDNAFINPQGRLTLVECKLWRNYEARRKVVAQALDYARAISRWSYADLQRQVSAATGRKGNVPFELAQKAEPDLTEHRFSDAVTRGLREGRFLLLIAGDGIREDVGGMAELVNRNAASAFSMGLVEVALYDLGDGGLAIQPRVIAQTKLIERTVVVVKTSDAIGADVETVIEDEADPETGPQVAKADTPKQAANRAWWAPVIATVFDDPEQPPPVLRGNWVRLALPVRHLWVTAYGLKDEIGVFLGGGRNAPTELREQIAADRENLLDELPEGTEINTAGPDLVVKTARRLSEFPDDAARQAWLSDVLNRYANAFRSRLGR